MIAFLTMLSLWLIHPADRKWTLQYFRKEWAFHGFMVIASFVLEILTACMLLAARGQ